MNNLLIVDDEVLIVDSIKAQYSWETLGIGQVYTANSVSQAIRVLEQDQIDILICDIEMGVHSGLELLEWIQKKELPIVSFVLTGYAEFNYCQKALELGCIGYVLKPIRHSELEKVITTAVEKVNKRKSAPSSEHWSKNQSSLANQFWMEVISNTVPSDREAILRKAKIMEVSLCGDDQFLMLLSHWDYGRREAESQFRRDELRYALNNMARDIFDGIVGELPAFISNSNYYIICKNSDETGNQMEKLLRDCRQMSDYAQEYLNTKLVFCVANFQPLEELSNQFRQLYTFFLRQNPLSANLLLLNQEDDQEAFYDKPPIQSWMVLLEAGEISKTQRKIEEYLDRCVEKGSLNVATLYWFWQDFSWMVQMVLNRHGLEAYPFSGEDWSQLEVPEIKEHVSSILQTVASKLRFSNKTMSVVDAAKEYIEENILSESLSRNAIAEHVDVNPEYLSHAFKKQEGVSLMDFISDKKVEIACCLLEDTKLSISDISVRLGYINFSYFSSLFKKKTGFSPAAYRKNHQK